MIPPKNFHSRYTKTDGCWEWQGHIHTHGYGVYTTHEKQWRAHRLAAAVAGMDINGKVVRHLCHNKTCVNPAHLAAGTQAENINDKVEAGRQAKGEGHGRVKLTEDQVREIRARAACTQAALAREFGVSKTQISRILKGESWHHLTQ